MQEVVIQKRREIISEGASYVNEVYARGYIDYEGRLRLTSCVGRSGPKPPAIGVTKISANHAA